MSLLFLLFAVVSFICSLRVWDHIEAAILYAVVSMFLVFIAHLSNKHTELCNVMREHNRREIFEPAIQKIKEDLSH